MPPHSIAGAWSEDLTDSYLALGRVDDAVRMISDTTRSSNAEGAEMPCEPAEKLMRSGTSLSQGRFLWQQARAGYLTMSGSMYRLVSDTATSATASEPGMADHQAGAGIARRRPGVGP